MTPQELKNSILQLAIQGKLVEQRPEEASVNLSKLKAKATDEYEFDLPEKWVISHLESISVPIPTKQYQVLESEVKKEGAFAVISQSKEYSIGFTDEKSKVFCHDTPVIVFGDHTTEVKYVTFDFVVGADGVKVFLPQIDYVFPKFLYYVFQFNCIGLNKAGGYSRHYKYIKDKPVPLPPLAEQKRIVAKIEELLPLIERYEKAWSRLEDFNKRFPGDMQKSILQMAIQGKLAEQRPEEGTGEELANDLLLKKKELVHAGKIMKKADTKPFYNQDELNDIGIPDTWCWVQLADVSIIQEGAGIRKWQYRDHGTQILCVTNILDGSVDLEKKKLYISTEEYFEKYQHLTPQKGDIVSSCSGGSWGKTAIFNCSDIMMLNTSTLRMRFFGDLASNDYLYYLTKSIFFKKQLERQLAGMQPNFGYAHYSRIMIPLPPLAEQKRIVARLEELLPLCERLK